ncbi:histone-lysine N-methyltransferase SETD2 [Paragonimus westermani]|uniref:Histone-lysine N-methyltransferase SETD2 n=1 Tax=Paragonimus westermani TaxID=34504 RepID=A0A5J4NRQ1_9TREM|nr:histone-lysine N-methyltransferase SETD2 [Paragonimus westermani]
MEYDPASPTDELEDVPDCLDISTIPLPDNTENLENAATDLCDIPLPPLDLKASDIPLPPSTVESRIDHSMECEPYQQTAAQPTAVDQVEIDSPAGPLKFSLRIHQKPLSGQENSSESSGVFESTKDLKSDEPRSMPKLQALMKRSKPSQLPVGVLPSKTKLPAPEVKTELFLPSKETDVNDAVEAVATTSSTAGLAAVLSLSSCLQPTESGGTLSNTMKDVNALAHFSSATPGQESLSVRLDNPASALSGISNPAMNNAVSTPSVIVTTSSISHIPNLMSLSVQPVPSVTLTQGGAGLTADAAVVLRQSKMSIANMQYVNPQKLRSAQMIATPLIANPAIAAQPHHNEESQKSRDNRRRSVSRRRSRSRSRSGRRSSPTRRSRRRHSSSSSSSTPPRFSARRYTRRSRSRHGSEERYSRGHAYPRNRGRDRRDYDRRRERYDGSSARRISRDRRVDNDRRMNSRCSPVDKDKRSRRFSGSRDRSEIKVSRKSPIKEDKGSHREKERPKKSNDSDRKSTDIKKDHYRPEKARAVEKSKVDSNKSRIEPPRSTRTSVKDNMVRKSDKLKEKRRSASSCESDSGGSSTSSKSPSPKQRKHVDKIETSTVMLESENSSTSRESSASSSASETVRHGVTTPDHDSDLSPTHSLSTRESELISVLHSKDAGIGLVAESQNEPISPFLLGADARDSSSDDEASSTVITNVDGDVQDDNVENSLTGSITLSKSAHDSLIIPDGDNPDDISPATPVGHLNDVKNPAVNLAADELTAAEVASNDPSSDISSISPAEMRNCSYGKSEAKYDLRQRKLRRSDIHQRLQLLVSNMRADFLRLSEPSCDVFAAFPDAPKPEYLHIIDNDYSNIDRLNSTMTLARPDGLPAARLLGSVGMFSSLTQHEMRHWVCDCTMPSFEEFTFGIACGPGCINRALNIECGPSCPAGNFCSNRQFQERLYAPTEPFYCGPGKGWGLRSTSVIEKNAFILEYVGEVINFAEFRRRVRRYERLGHSHHYFMALEADRFIDAGTKGNWARFVNHSCEPNCVTQKWSVDGKIRIGFFAREHISPGEEITIDYQFVQFGASEQKCYCGTASCSGIMGSVSKNLQEKVRLKDTAVIERRVMQLLQRDAFTQAEDITLLLQVMVQECLTRYTRLELLKRLVVTDSVACLKLFRQYNGLDMLAAFMCDAAPDDWELKRQILVCLNKIPVSEQKQVQSNSRLMDIVLQWTLDPRFCRSRGNAPNDQSFSTTDVNENTSPNHSADKSLADKEGQSNPTLPIEQMGSHASAGLVTDRDIHLVSFAIDRPAEIDSPALDGFPSVSDSCPSTPTSTQSSVISRITTRSSSLVPTDSRSTIEGISCPTMLNGTQPNISLSFVDVEASEVEPTISSEDPDTPISTPTCSETDPPSLPRGLQEHEWILEIRSLASKLIDKWTKLPKENYRIPRLERQETEKELHVANCPGSSLISLGHNDNQKSAASWGRVTTTAATNRSKRSATDNGSRSSSSNCDLAAVENNPIQKLSKTERRKLFEAQVIAAEAEKSVFTLEEASKPPSMADQLRDLLLRALVDEMQTGQPTAINTELMNLDDSKTVALVTTFLQMLPRLLSKVTTSKELATVRSLADIRTPLVFNVKSQVMEK